MSEAKKDRPAIAFTEGYLLSKDKHCHNFFMSISEDEIGEEMIIYNKNIVKIKKVGSIEFTKEDFEFDTYKDYTHERTYAKDCRLWLYHML